MDLTESELRHLEQLARVKLTGASREKLRGQLARIIDFVAKLQEVDTAASEPLPPAGDRGPQTRPDVTQPCLDRDEVLSESPASEGGMFTVPPVIDTGER
ncbi:MAG TPA: Asp-tRNA(Asn)/Glu-tRNA(Gln) amidotransferase subunit GatC [Patescibacteria group bacterium]|nr:Asp-tRNA(Asn)/Glu-tRNA(Gln) amidotransferase subunit GatC [Patescibacteria group bacterium]